MAQLIIRFLVGGLVVSSFAVLADVLKPKSFAGLFGAASSVALATLGLTILANGKLDAAVEARSMVLGAFSFLVYACFVDLSEVVGHADSSQYLRPLENKMV